MNETEVSQMDKIRVFLAKIVRRIGYWLIWRRRDIGALLYGVDVKQTADLLGVMMPTGEFVPYGEEYHRLYFKGKIREVVGQL